MLTDLRRKEMIRHIAEQRQAAQVAKAQAIADILLGAHVRVGGCSFVVPLKLKN